MQQQLLDHLGELEQVVDLLKATFVAKDELIELLATSAIAQEHLLIVGPPGTAKSELIKRFALYCRAEDGGYFEYLLTRFTEPNEIFGPVNIAAFREGEGMFRQTEGMLPQAQIAFLDEVFKANSAILNAFLTILNERIFYNGSQREKVPLIFAVGATNNVPEESDLAALYDRFLLRVWTDNVEESLFGELYQRGWLLEQERIASGYRLQEQPITSTKGLQRLYEALSQVDMSQVAAPYRTAVRQIRAEGIQLSDRRAIKLLKLIAASALRNRRMIANPGDFWVLRHVWNDPEQLPHLQTIVDPYVTGHSDNGHRAERLLAQIEAELQGLALGQARLKTDIDYGDYLAQVEGVRRQLLHHSAATAAETSAERQKHTQLAAEAERLIAQVMSLLEKSL